MWTCQATEALRKGDAVYVSLLFSDGAGGEVRKTFEHRDPTDEGLKAFARQVADRLQRIDDFVVAAPKGEVDLTPPGVTPPTEKQLYQNLELELALMKADFARKVELKIVLADDATWLAAIAAKETAVKAAYKPEFVPVVDAVVVEG